MADLLSSYQLPQAGFPKSVGACFTLRSGGYSEAPFDSFNLGLHVGDNPSSVCQNRQKILQDQKLEGIFWLNQVHGMDVVKADFSEYERIVEADASFTSEKNLACAIMVADCLPVLVSDASGSVVGAAHAGWRGLCSGVIRNLVNSMAINPEEAIVWLGPCIGSLEFEVGEDVFSAFQKSTVFTHVCVEKAFIPNREGHFLADLQCLARLQLESIGITNIYAATDTVFSNSRDYFSYRRDIKTGRMAALIWIK